MPNKRVVCLVAIWLLGACGPSGKGAADEFRPKYDAFRADMKKLVDATTPGQTRVPETPLAAKPKLGDESANACMLSVEELTKPRVDTDEPTDYMTFGSDLSKLRSALSLVAPEVDIEDWDRRVGGAEIKRRLEIGLDIDYLFVGRVLELIEPFIMEDKPPTDPARYAVWQEWRQKRLEKNIVGSFIPGRIKVEVILIDVKKKAVIAQLQAVGASGDKITSESTGVGELQAAGESAMRTLLIEKGLLDPASGG